jgi:curved DNA-binding protein
LKVEIDPHPVYRISGRDLTMDLPVAPWEAVLGADVSLMTLAGEVSLKVPPGTQSGQKLRLRGKGMPNPKGGAGDLYVLVNIVVPKEPSGQERELFEKLQQVSSFRPRS